MKKILTAAFAVATGALSLCAATKVPAITNVEPPCWWTGMHNPTLQLMVTGPGIAGADFWTDFKGVTIDSQTVLDSPDYKFLYLTIGKDTQPGTMTINYTLGKGKGSFEYQLLAREKDAAAHGGFDATDVLYLVMPDRFAAGQDNGSEKVKTLRNKVLPDRSKPNARHGGDLAGLTAHLDYIDSLGVTAIWVCPVLENDMPGGSYHGYATTNHYRIDPRLGTNGQWRNLIEKAHDKGLKVVMDMIFNHAGSGHPWLANPPSKDWFNHPGGDIMTNYRLTTVHDPYVSDYDLDHTVNGWFVPDMPDLNQRNPHLMKYLTQNSIWWIEWSKTDGIRMDTYPYADAAAMSKWAKDVLAEYPNFNIVGECWYGNEAGSAYWQSGNRLNPDETYLPTVMDFFFIINGRKAFGEDTTPRGGLNAVYDHLAQDFLYADPQKVLTFLDNHDSDRFLPGMPKDLDAWKQAQAFLLTTRGIPQIYYGTEILMHGSKEGSDGYVRLDFPGGFAGDSDNAFSAQGRTDLQNQAWDFLSKLLHWRRGPAGQVIARGKMKHFMPQNGVYTYQRTLGDDKVTVLLNGRDTTVDADMARVAEALPAGSLWHDVITGNDITVTPQMTLQPRQVMILQNR